jgi:hypothetical protein
MDLYNNTGALINKIDLKEKNRIVLNLEILSKGIYFIKYYVHKKEFMYKFIVE